MTIAYHTYNVITAPGPASGGWTRMFLSTSQRDDFEVPDLDDLRLEIPGIMDIIYYSKFRIIQ
jgi:hypothetical protein